MAPKPRSTRSFIEFPDDQGGPPFVVMRNRGQKPFDQMPEAFVLIDARHGVGFYLERRDAELLHTWLGKRLAEGRR